MAAGEEEMTGGRRAGSRRKGRGARCWLAVCLGVLALAGSTVPAQQREVPRRIVSIVPALTEMLFAIGAGPQVVGVSSFARFPAAVEGLPRVGALLDPDMERVFSLRPDLVLLYGSQRDQRAQIARAGIPVFSYRHGGLDDVTATVRELGRRTGHAAEAGVVAEEIEREVAAIRARVAGRTPARALVVIGREPGIIRNVYASGGIGFIHDMLEAAGGENVFADVAREAAQPTSEAILAAAPDVIIELRAEGILTPEEIERETKVWRRLSTVPAVRQARVHFLIGTELVVPGPRVAEATRRLAELLHPDAF